MRGRWALGAIVAVALAAGACQVRKTEQAPIAADTAAAPAVDGSAPGRSTWVVHARGAGPLAIGMSAAEAGQALGGALDAEASAAGCHQLVSNATPAGIRLMFEDGRLVRIDVELPGLATEREARVGMTEDEVRGLYGDSLRIMPHKYDASGHYLVHSPDGAGPGEGYRTLFETDGAKVLRYRVGQEPQVENVEGCS